MLQAPLAESLLDDLLVHRDLILVTGKGGTGKSTLVAALAQLAARRRGRALAVEFSLHPRLPAMVAPGASVDCVDIDPEQVIGPALARLLKLPALVGATLANRVLRLFLRTSPSVREMVALDELSFRVEQAARARIPVVADLPSTGHALSFLETPRAVHRMLRVGPLAAVAQRVERLVLDGSRCELVAVALPEELPINETIELVQRLTAAGVASRTVVVNQVPSPELHLDGGDHQMLEALQSHANDALSRFAGAARVEVEVAQRARDHLARLRAALPASAQVLEVPRFPADEPRACVQSVVDALERRR